MLSVIQQKGQPLCAQFWFRWHFRKILGNFTSERIVMTLFLNHSGRSERIVCGSKISIWLRKIWSALECDRGGEIVFTLPIALFCHVSVRNVFSSPLQVVLFYFPDLTWEALVNERVLQNYSHASRTNHDTHTAIESNHAFWRLKFKCINRCINPYDRQSDSSKKSKRQDHSQVQSGHVEEKFERNFRVNRKMRDEILVYESILDQILSEILILGFRV